jgi:hypothetical protein
VQLASRQPRRVNFWVSKIFSCFKIFALSKFYVATCAGSATDAGSSAMIEHSGAVPITRRRPSVMRVFNRLFRQARFTQVLRDAVGVLLPRHSFQP